MSNTDANKAIVQRFLDEVVSRGKLDVLDQVMAKDLKWHGGSFGELTTLDQFRQMMPAFFTAFPDMKVTTEEILADGDKVVVRHHWTGTNKGAFFGMPPTGKKVRVTGMNVYRVGAGKIQEEWWGEDIYGLMQQLGVVKAPGQG